MPDYQKYTDDDLKRHQRDIRKELRKRKEETEKKERVEQTLYR